MFWQVMGPLISVAAVYRPFELQEHCSADSSVGLLPASMYSSKGSV